MGQLITVTILGGACFGMPTAMVNERERGVWRRYRLLPAATGGIILSAMVARFLIVASAALIQIGLARAVYGTPMPRHPGQLAIAFVFVTFAFLGLGLLIAMLADNVPAVQALGQAIFLPMIMIGGVGIPLRLLAPWAQVVAGFFPGRYAVEAMDACIFGKGLDPTKFSLLALTIIGLAAIVAGAKLFRWDMGQRIAKPARVWLIVALVAWAGVGLAAERTGKLKPVASSPQSGSLAEAVLGSSTGSGSSSASETQATTLPATAPTAFSQLPGGATPPAPIRHVPWYQTTDQQINSVTYDDLPDDGGAVTPYAGSLDGIDPDTKQRLDDLSSNLLDWRPGQVADVGQRVRNLLYVCAIPDIAQDILEAYTPVVVFDFMKSNIQRDELAKALAAVALEPEAGNVISNIKELGFEGDMPEDTVRERAAIYARKFLYRLLGKDKEPEKKPGNG
jgi:ABC-2 type transport system permease protein